MLAHEEQFDNSGYPRGLVSELRSLFWKLAMSQALLVLFVLAAGMATRLAAARPHRAARGKRGGRVRDRRTGRAAARPGEGRSVMSVLWTGQVSCHNAAGRAIPCAGIGQNAEFRRGRACGRYRVSRRAARTVLDRLTGLLWRRKADLAGPLLWEEALASVAELNRRANPGRWRLPNLNELESLVDAKAARPALTAGHPFGNVRDVLLYWSSTASLYQPDWAWALYLDKGAAGVGHKTDARFHAWAVADMA